MAKAIALHGLGVHVYSGEDIADIPDNLEVEKPKEIQKPELKKVEEQVKKIEEKASKPDTLKIDVPEKDTFQESGYRCRYQSSRRVWREDYRGLRKKIALTSNKTVDDLTSYYRREEATLENLKQNAVDVYDKIKDLFTKRKEQING